MALSHVHNENLLTDKELRLLELVDKPRMESRSGNTGSGAESKRCLSDRNHGNHFLNEDLLKRLLRSSAERG